MWLVLAPRVRPDLYVWPGRRWLSAVDALAWPFVLAACMYAAPVETGVVGKLGVACCCLSAVWRLKRAVLSNERYRLTTVWITKLLAPLVLLGALLKLGQVLGAH
ncbi:hypothetical protein [Rubrivivax gelatinosus]|uniref:hypothetical protein n=1 Tax=Rubrivivax gelatinosus TaxID=28068 RepID=UPI001904930E|nr:hypothetical protein [Rubrivivax gelatinosus]